MSFILTEEDKIKAIDHIWYEMFQFFNSAKLLSHDSPLDENVRKYLNSTLLECLLIHFRALLYFYKGKRSVKDDVLITDFDPNFDQNEISEIITPEDWDRINKDLAHLTYLRGKRTASDKNWEWGKYIKSLKPICRKTVSYLKTSYPNSSKYKTLNNNYPLDDLLKP